MSFLFSCSTTTLKQDSNLSHFKKICLDGSGKGRIELVNSKFVFDFESQINKKTNYFELSLAFPIVGEKKLSLSLSPKIAALEIENSQFVKEIETYIGERHNKIEIKNALLEFFVLTSEFLHYRTLEKLPSTFQMKTVNDHFYIERLHGNFRFEVESFEEEEGFFRRVLVKIYPQTGAISNSLFTLFLVPETCDAR